MKDSTHLIYDHREHYKVPIPSTIMFCIWLFFGILAIVPVIFIFGSPTILKPRNLSYHPLYSYFEQQFKVNGFNKKTLSNDLFSQKSLQKKKEGKTLAKNKNIVNIVYSNVTQSFHFDNWYFLGKYFSFLMNKQNRLIQKKVVTQQFLQLYQRLKSQSQNQEQFLSEVKINKKIAKYNQAHFFHFSQTFQQIIKYQTILITQLSKKTFMESIKISLQNFIGYYLNKFNLLTKVKHKVLQNQVWIIWLFHLKGQPLKDSRKQLLKLRRKYPGDKFIILSFQPVLQQSKEIIRYEKLKQKNFEKLLKNYLNTSQSQSRLIAKSFDYSLLQLSKKVKDQQSFTMNSLIGQNDGYDLNEIFEIYKTRVNQMCEGIKTISTDKIFQQDQKMQFYRLGLYKFGNKTVWKNKNSKTNYEYHVGKYCKKIPVFHNNYEMIFETLRKNYIYPIAELFTKKRSS